MPPSLFHVPYTVCAGTSEISKNIYENVFLLTLLFWFISASDGVDVWHLRLDQEQLDSHV